MEEIHKTSSQGESSATENGHFATEGVLFLRLLNILALKDGTGQGGSYDVFYSDFYPKVHTAFNLFGYLQQHPPTARGFTIGPGFEVSLAPADAFSAQLKAPRSEATEPFPDLAS